MDGGSSEKKSHTSPTHTREQVAKLSGVGTGTVARFNKVMNSDDEELKNFMYVSTPEDFADKVKRISEDESYYKHIKYLQRKAVYDKYKSYCNAETLSIFESWLKEPE